MAHLSSNHSNVQRSAVDICLTDRQMMFAVYPIEKILIGNVVPILVFFGISGNILNLTILLTPNMRTRSNQLLACLAVADIVCLISMIPHALANYDLFAKSLWFRQIYLDHKFHIIAMLNWSSAAAMWLILVICIERLMGIKYPLSVRKGKILSPKIVVSFVVVITGILTSHHHFSYTCATKFFCNGTQYHGACLKIDSERWFRNEPNPHSEVMKTLVRYAPHVHAIFIVLIPIILVIISNIMLILTLRQRKNVFAPIKAIRSDSHSNSNAQTRTERKVTITVTAIVTCFTITQGPSAFVTILSEYTEHKEWMVTLTASVSTLVVLGKALNFVLFCLSSKGFRQRLLLQTKQGILRKSTRYSTVNI